jgi:hypothetical protein
VAQFFHVLPPHAHTLLAHTVLTVGSHGGSPPLQALKLNELIWKSPMSVEPLPLTFWALVLLLLSADAIQMQHSWDQLLNMEQKEVGSTKFGVVPHSQSEQVSLGQFPPHVSRKPWGRSFSIRFSVTLKNA